MPSTVALSVARYRPEMESEPTFQTYEVPFRKDWVVLDALNHVKDSLDGSLSYRWSCRMGVCGSCGMKVNGTPKLTCATFLSDYMPGPIRVEPLDYFPVVRDLVVDLTDLVLADRDAIRYLRDCETGERFVLRNCPEYVRVWMAAEENR